MDKCLIYEDDNGNCKLIVPGKSFQQKWESEENALSRLYQTSIPSVAEFIVCDLERIPKDLTFRQAWKKGTTKDPIVFDFEKALEIHRKRIQEVCQKKIEKLNRELEIALEDDNLPAAVAVRRTKKILRVYHDNMNLSHCKTMQDIKYSIPQELHDSWEFYDPKM